MADKQILPASITGRTDLTRLSHDLQMFDEQMQQQAIKKVAKQPTPEMSELLQTVSNDLKLDLKKSEDRDSLKQLLDETLKSSPAIHMSFAAVPSPAFMQKIVAWFRKEIHPSALIQVGLQPDIAAGCIVRTANKQFDLSLRQSLQAKQALLIQSIRGQDEQPK